MGDDDDGDALLAAGILQKLQDRPAGLVVQGAGGLVAEQELGVLREGSRDGDPLLLAAGELGREVVHPVGKAHVPQHLLGVQGVRADLGRQLHVLESRQVLDQVIELEDEADVPAAVLGELPGVVAAHLAAVHQDGPLRAGVHPAQHVQHRGLARPAGAHDDHELPLLDLKADVVHGADLHLAAAVDLRHVPKGHERLAHAFSSFITWAQRPTSRESSRLSSGPRPASSRSK